MKLFVSGRFVDLSFETTPPLTLTQQFANHSVATSAARAMAIMLHLDCVIVSDGGSTGIEYVSPKNIKASNANRKNVAAKRIPKMRTKNSRPAKRKVSRKASPSRFKKEFHFYQDTDDEIIPE